VEQTTGAQHAVAGLRPHASATVGRYTTSCIIHMGEQRMGPELKSILDRADELLKDLEGEYTRCLHSHKVTERAKNITHEILEKLRNALDQTMRKAWENTSRLLSLIKKESVRVFIFQLLVT